MRRNSVITGGAEEEGEAGAVEVRAASEAVAAATVVGVVAGHVRVAARVRREEAVDAELSKLAPKPSGRIIRA